MPEKSKHSAYMRQWRLNNPAKCKVYNEKNAALKKKLGVRRQGLATSQFDHSLGPPMEPTQKHVVLSRLLRRLLQEAWDKGFLKTLTTQDDTEYETRVKAALDVSSFLKFVEPDEPDESDAGGEDDTRR